MFIVHNIIMYRPMEIVKGKYMNIERTLARFVKCMIRSLLHNVYEYVHIA